MKITTHSEGPEGRPILARSRNWRSLGEPGDTGQWGWAQLQRDHGRKPRTEIFIILRDTDERIERVLNALAPLGGDYLSPLGGSLAKE